MKKLTTFIAHRPNLLSGDRVALTGRDPLDATRGLRVSYSSGGASYTGAFCPERVVESAAILGGKGGYEVFGTVAHFAHGQTVIIPTTVCLHK